MNSVRSSKNLFTDTEKARLFSVAPLAFRMRPRNLDEFVGQRHFIGPQKLLRRMLDSDRLTSLIFYGPAGVGKTSLAMLIANHTKSRYCCLSAPASSVSDIRQVISESKDLITETGKRTVLFIDEIHRFSRAQQDVLLNDVESGILILIGATTENPFFSINSPLLSRSTLFEFNPLSDSDITSLLRSALTDKQRGLGRYNVEFDEDALDFIALTSDGDARRALGALEIGVLSQSQDKKTKKIKFDLNVAKESIQKKTIGYDKGGDTHYDLASALQKSMRGSDPDATIYWLARMIAGGEDTRFIARRIAVCAAEDVGNADPMATVLAAAAMQISEFVGLPDAQLHLAQAAIYVACAPKSNASAMAIWNAVSDVKTQKIIPVPPTLKDSRYAGARKKGYGSDYKYPHNYDSGFVVQDYIPKEYKKNYYQPKDRGREKNIRNYLNELEKFISKSKNKDDD